MGCVPTGRRISVKQGMTGNSSRSTTSRPTATFPQPPITQTKQITTQVVTVAPPPPHPPLPHQTLTPASYKTQVPQKPPPNQYQVSTVVGGPPPMLISQLPPMQPLTPYSQTKVNTGAPMNSGQQEINGASQRMTSPSMVSVNQGRPGTPPPTPPPQYQRPPQMQYSQMPPPPQTMNSQSQYRIIQQQPGQAPQPPYPQNQYPAQQLQPPQQHHQQQQQPPQQTPPPSSQLPSSSQYMSISRVNHSQGTMNQSAIPTVNQSFVPTDNTHQSKQTVESSAFRSAVFGSNNHSGPTNQSILRELNKESADVNDQNFSEIKIEKMDFAGKGTKETKAY